MHDRVLLVSSAPIAASRLTSALYGPRLDEVAVFAVMVARDADVLELIGRALAYFDATRIVLAVTAEQIRRDLTGQVEDRFGRPVMAA
jgi:hypothetical protein